MGIKASDIYGGMNKTFEDTQPKQSKSQQQNAQANATGQKQGGYGMIALLGIAGILIGAKFAGER